MPLKSTLSLLVHLLLAGWMGSLISGYSLGVRHGGEDTGFNTLYDPSNSLAREPRNAIEESSAVKVPARVLFLRTAPQKTTEIPHHQNIVLECKAGGHPMPVITWMKNGVEIDQGDYWNSNGIKDTEAAPSGLGSTMSRLYLDCVQPEDVGQYTCVATTPYQRVTSDTDAVLVRNPGVDIPEEVNPSCQRQTSFVFGPGPLSPRIYTYTTRLLQIVGKDALLFCRAFGNPSPSIKWTKDANQVIPSNPRQIVLQNGDLLIRNINWVDMGLYNCEVENSHGKDNVSSFLYPMQKALDMIDKLVEEQ